MELTYMVRGTDGQQYGPATLEQLNGWVREGRVPAQQEIKRSDMEHWAPASSFSELQPAFAVNASPVSAGAVSVAAAFPAPAAAPLQAAVTAGQIRSGGSWFYWIAGLSLINSIAAFSGSSWRFIVGLGVTQVLDAVGSRAGGGGKAVVLVLDLITAAVFILFGVFACKGQAWAFVVGMGLFALDGLIFLLAGNWIGVGFHLFVLYFLGRAFLACRTARAAQAG